MNGWMNKKGMEEEGETKCEAGNVEWGTLGRGHTNDDILFTIVLL